MRLWSIHPKYLDSRGLVALWREGLLAQKVLSDKTQGYRHHPQLIRFRKAAKPLAAIGFYLAEVASEAERRGYQFDRSKIAIANRRRPLRMTVARGQLEYESKHLLEKLRRRDPARFRLHSRTKRFSAHPIFRPVAGGVESWERLPAI